ncbi:MAG: glycosyltransferase family 4 protein [Candidatus Liptonbacteria bacterium]|nr:glycosyltransferase family 4 protein [Candidatus Liptonbacteria bacterium]
MKIGIVNFDLGAPMGDTRCTGSFARALKKSGHEVIVYTTDFNPGLFYDLWSGIEVKVFPQKPPLEKILLGSSGIFARALRKVRTNLWARRAARDFSGKIDPDLDILDCHNWYTYKIAPLYRKINSRARIIWTMHDPPFNYRPKKNPILNLLALIQFYVEPLYEKRFYSCVDEIIVMDERSRNIAKDYSPKVRLLYLGIDYDHFYMPPRKRDRKKRLRLLGVGSMSPYRRFEDIIEATRQMRENGLDALATIVCRDFWGDKAYQESFLSAMKNSGIEKFLDSRQDGVSEEELLKIFRESDVYVFPNHIRIWGMAAFEAMAAGLPLIVSNITSASEVLKDGENALFVDPLRPDQIAQQAKKLSEDDGFYRKIAGNGQKFVRDNLTWENYAKNFLSDSASQ